MTCHAWECILLSIDSHLIPELARVQPIGCLGQGVLQACFDFIAVLVSGWGAIIASAVSIVPREEGRRKAIKLVAFDRMRSAFKRG